MSFSVAKLIYADGRAYQYQVLSETGQLLYVAERTGLLLPTATALTEFYDTDHRHCARLQPPDVVPWQRAQRFEVFVGPEVDEPEAVIIEERFRPVDEMLLRLPAYELMLGGQHFTARGSRYGDYLYGFFRVSEEGELGVPTEQVELPPPDLRIRAVEGTGPIIPAATLETVEGVLIPRPEVKIGQITSPTTGPCYIVEAVAAPLRDAVLPLAALAILIDITLYS
jgi:hypothetical protein